MTDLNLQIADRVKLLEYITALEHTRADLMSAVNEARDKCGALERGNLILQQALHDSTDREIVLQEREIARRNSKMTATVGIEPNP